MDPNFKRIHPGWALSPDATKIAILGGSDIYLLNVKTKALQHIIVKHWNNLGNTEWTPDGNGLFISSLQPRAVLLHTDLHGNAQVLWEPATDFTVWAVPSPDGKHVAMPLMSISSNVWMMENF